MPQIFRIGSYNVYFWVNEGNPLEPVHVHISQGIPASNATKVWITKTGKGLICNNNSHIPSKTLRRIIQIIEACSPSITELWLHTFGTISYYC